MEAGGGSKRLMYTPHLKKVLKTYQAAATSSLHGPNSVMGVWQGSESDDAASVSPPSSTCPPSVTDAPQDRAECSGETSVSTKSTACSTSASTSKDALEYDPFIAPPPFPIQQPPIFTPPDQSGCKKSETVFEGEIISCFEVGGEERLCLPQILNSVLREFSLQQINSVCDNLYIYISRCNAAQLEVLKATRVLPLNAPSCGLITKTDAHRLCAALLGFKHQIFMQTEKKPPFQVPIYHECFGRCSGLYMPDLFIHPHNPCIECVECQGLLSPQKFVCHVHSSKETRTCHWGFDVLKWQAYILLEVGLEDNVQFQEALREMKDRFTVVCKRKQVRKNDSTYHWHPESTIYKKTVEESCDPSSKKIRTESYYSYPYSVDPMLVCYYNSHMWDNAFQTYPSVITKDGKALYIPPENFPPLIQKSIPNFRNRLALTPANAQKLMPLMKLPEEQTIFAYHAHKSESLSRRPYLKKEYEHESPSCCMDSEDTFSDTSFSTLSAGTEDGLISTIDEEEEFQSSSETELLGLKKLLNDIDASLRTSIMSEVETLIAKYRKCLKVAVQGKKLYQMELEKLHYTQKEKLRKLRERNKLLEKDLLKYQSSSSVNANEQYESQSSRSTPKPLSSSPCSPEVERQTVTGSTCAGNETCSIKAERREEIDVDTEENKTFCSAPSPTLPKLSPDPKAEPLGQ